MRMTSMGDSSQTEVLLTHTRASLRRRCLLSEHGLTTTRPCSVSGVAVYTRTSK